MRFFLGLSRERFVWGRLREKKNSSVTNCTKPSTSTDGHVMGLYTREGTQVYQLLHWEFIPILNKINNIMIDGKNNGCRMFIRDSQHFPTPTCASTLHNVHIQEGPPDTNPKYSIHERSDRIHLTFGNFLQHFLFSFWPYRSLPIVGFLFMLDKYRT